MSSTAIKLKKSSVVGKSPLVADLDYGELAINYADGRVYYKNSSNQIKSFADSDLVSALVNTSTANYLNGNIDVSLIPDSNESIDLGSPTKRFNELYLAGNTINIGGATISSDGTGAISISGSGATLPAGSKIALTDSAEEKIAVVGAEGAVIIEVPLFTQATGLDTVAKTFQFKGNPDSKIFTSFVLNNGSSVGQTSAEIQFHF